jgi:hypothetical protein
VLTSFINYLRHKGSKYPRTRRKAPSRRRINVALFPPRSLSLWRHLRNSPWLWPLGRTSGALQCIYALCQEGRVVHWGSFYNIDTLATKWSETNPTIPWQERFVSPLLYWGKKDDIFASRTPSDIPAITTKALHTFWSSGAPSLVAKEGKPSDFP